MTQGNEQSHTLQIEDAGRISLLSHDIRSTYGELQSALKMLAQDAHLPQRLQNELSRLSHTGAHLGRLLDEVSEAIFHDHQKRPPPVLSSAPRLVLTGLVQRWQRITEKLGSELLLSGTDHLPDIADLDMLALEQVLSNLVSNALHHAGPGPISIDIARSGQDAQEELVFRIRDSGPGYPPSVLGSVALAPPPIGAGEPGSGFGLHVAFDATRRLNGKLKLQNPPDGGAEACLTLPFPRPNTANTDTIAQSQHLPEGLVALLVEDSAALRLGLRHDLEALGLTVIEAHDGIEALERLTDPKTHIDIVFLDIELPLLSGLQVLSRLRAQDQSVPPTVAITSHVFMVNRQTILSHGVKTVLRKPVSAQRDILEAIATALELDHPLSPAQPMFYARPARVALPQDVLADCLDRLIAHLPCPTAREVLTQMSDDLDRYLDEATRAMQDQDGLERHAQVSRACHSLSALFATVNMKTAQRASRVLSERSDQMPPSDIIEILRQLRQYASNIQTAIHSILTREMDTDVPPTHFNRR
ncbi:response regulator [Celeribacter naphthalenivorans]|uniref:response regulator n=1 Tax=Celeribacter naphthalenivorans TaxID=1614694 RepID=UPI001CFC2092|nr:response regulator [Celeribacter naphthalenivorans]